jgi:hypothetical protein
MSIKGTVIPEGDYQNALIPRGFRQRHTKPQLDAFIAEHNRRQTIVGYCPHCELPDGSPRPLIAEEEVAHRLQHLSGAAKSIAARFEAADAATRAEVLAYIQAYCKG